MIVKANRIDLGEDQFINQLISHPIIILLLIVWLIWCVIGVYGKSRLYRLGIATIALWLLFFTIGWESRDVALTANNSLIRAVPAGAFWGLFGVFSLSFTDALLRFELKPKIKLLIFIVFSALFLLLIKLGLFDTLGIMREFSIRKSQFATEGLQHLFLTFSSVFMGLIIGLPLGIFCYMCLKASTLVLQILSFVQTIPSLALFGLLMAPLAYLSHESHFLNQLGVSGIGTTPALVALILYNLLPITANTFVGLKSVPQAVRDASKGMGMNTFQILILIELPIAMPIILTGIRIVLVQTIGLVTIAALIGGGGFGSFVFQGIGQTATDLVLLGALPMVYLAFSAALILDTIVISLNKYIKPT